jgi:hypothetical protein
MPICNYCAEEITADSVVCPFCEEKNPFRLKGANKQDSKSNTKPNEPDHYPLADIQLFKKTMLTSLTFLFLILSGPFVYKVVDRYMGLTLAGQLDELSNLFMNNDAKSETIEAKFLPDPGNVLNLLKTYKASLSTNLTDVESKEILDSLYDPIINDFTGGAGTWKDNLVDNLLKSKFLSSGSRGWRIHYGFLSPGGTDLPVIPTAMVKTGATKQFWVKMKSGWKILYSFSSSKNNGLDFTEDQDHFLPFEDTEKNVNALKITFANSNIIAALKMNLRAEKIEKTENNRILIANAIKKAHKGKKKKWPESLDALVPKYLPSIPQELINGNNKVVTKQDGTGGWIYDNENGTVAVNVEGYTAPPITITKKQTIKTSPPKNELKTPTNESPNNDEFNTDKGTENQENTETQPQTDETNNSSSNADSTEPQTPNNTNTEPTPTIETTPIGVSTPNLPDPNSLPTPSNGDGAPNGN